MLKYFRKNIFTLRGYTLVEVMVSIAIYAIMAVVIFSSGPNLGRAISFNNEANLIADTIRDLQIKGSTAFTGQLQSNTNASTTNSATTTNIVGIGMSFFATTSTSKVSSNSVNNVKLFYIAATATLSQYGAYTTKQPYDPAFTCTSSCASWSYNSWKQDYNSNSSFSYLKLPESYIDNIFVGTKAASSTSVAFIRGDVRTFITVATTTNNPVNPLPQTTNTLFIQLRSANISPEVHRCVVVEYYGGVRVEGGKCAPY